MFTRRKQPQGSAIEGYAHTVEQILLVIGIDPGVSRTTTTEGFGWNFRRGSALIEIYVTQHEGVGYFQVVSPILHLPMTGLLAFYRHLLELNMQLTSAALGIYLDAVYVFSERPLQGLDAVEANALIDMVATYADDLDDKLINEFGGRFYGRV